MITHEPITSEQLSDHIGFLETRLEAIEHKVDANTVEIHNIHATLVRYQGFVGGALFIIGGLGIVLSLFKVAISKALEM